MKQFVLLISALLVFSCKPAEEPKPETPDAGPQQNPGPDEDELGITPIGAACMNLRKIKCADGFPHPKTKKTCYNTLNSTATKLSIDVPSSCLTAAATVEAARNCGDKNTMRVRCLE